MPNILKHPSATSTKLLFIGESGAGKTGALCSLAAAGYKLRILDMDNGVELIKDYLSNPNSPYVKQNPDCWKNVEYRIITDVTKSSIGKVICTQATAWPTMLRMLNEWKYTSEDGEEINYGKPHEWGSDTILVIDSLTSAAYAALNYHLAQNGALSAARTQNEARRDIGAAQDYIRGLLAIFKDATMSCNLILTSQITQVSESGMGPQSDEVKKEGESIMGFPAAIGRALSPQIPRYFNTVLQAKVVGTKQIITTKTQGDICTKNTAPLRVKPQYDLATGLADYFRDVRGNGPSAGGPATSAAPKIPLKED
jgi:hypothetical protein